MLDNNVRRALSGSCAEGHVVFDHPLRGHSTISIGGKADAWFVPSSPEELERVIRLLNEEGIRAVVIGNGSNTLIPDEGLCGVAINLSDSAFRGIEARGQVVTAGAGACLGGLLRYCCQRGLAGLEGLSGIPGTVGGALCMNASYRSAISDRLVKVHLVGPDGRGAWIEKKDIKFGYRYSSLKGKGVITSGVFHLEPEDAGLVKARMTEYFADKLERQPLGKKTLGCVFKNPAKVGYASGELIDRTGMRGLCRGDAQVSEKHANFIVNRARASCRDVIELIREVREKVLEKFSVELEPEIEILDSGR